MLQNPKLEHWLRNPPNGHNMRNRRRRNVDFTSKRQKQNIDGWSFDGQKIDVISTYLLWRNFDDVFSVLFVQRNLNGRNFEIVSTYIFQPNFDGKKIDLISMYLFLPDFDWPKIDVVLIHFFEYSFNEWKIEAPSTWSFGYLFW